MNRLFLSPNPSSNDDSGALPSLGRSSAELLERYLDGQLDERERRIFEKSLDVDPVLREHLQMQQRIDASLRAQFAPPEIAAVSTPLEDSTRSWTASMAPNSSLDVDYNAAGAAASLPRVAGVVPAPKPAKRISWLRVAALVVLSVSGYFAYTSLLTNRPLPSPTYITAAAAYSNEVASGMQPYTICTTSEAFAAYTKERLGTALAIEPTVGLTLIGWNYGQFVYSRDTISMLAKYNDQPVVILMDKATSTPKCGSNGELDQASRAIGGVLLHEIRPKGLPSVLDRFKIVQ